MNNELKKIIKKVFSAKKEDNLKVITEIYLENIESCLKRIRLIDHKNNILNEYEKNLIKHYKV